MNMLNSENPESESVSFDNASLILDEEESGIVILSANEDDDASLSLPESVPSDVNSIHFQVPSPILVPRDEELEEEEPDLLLGLDPASAERLLYKERHCAIMNLYILVVLGLLAFCGATVSLVRERTLLRETLRDLEAQAQSAAQAEEQSRAHYEKTIQLEEQVKRLKKENARKERSDQSHRFPWEEDTVIADNCWVHAKAKMGLGECAAEATQSAKKQFGEVSKAAKKRITAATNVAKKHVQGFAKTATKAQEQVWEQLHQDFTVTKEWFKEEFSSGEETAKEYSKTAAKSVWEQLHQDFTGTKEWFKEEFSSGEETAKTKGASDFKTVAKSVLSTAAMGTVAALVVGAADSFWGGFSNDDDAWDLGKQPTNN